MEDGGPAGTESAVEEAIRAFSLVSLLFVRW